MDNLPILHIGQFKGEDPLEDFYSSDLASHLERNHERVSVPHRHEFYLCVLFTKGIGVHEVDFNTYEVQAGCAFFLKPGQTHSWQFQEAPEGYIFFHGQSLFELYFTHLRLADFPFYASYQNSKLLHVSAMELPLMAQRFRELNWEYMLNQPYKKDRIVGLVQAIYIEMARCYSHVTVPQQEVPPSYLQTITSLETLLEQHYKTEKLPRFYAEKLHITPKHLNRICKLMLGKTTTDLITERVVLEAKRQMVHSALSLSQIAEGLGYWDYPYFSRLFRTKTGTTPKAFRKDYK